MRWLRVAAVAVMVTCSSGAAAYGGYESRPGRRVGTTFNDPDAGNVRIAATAYWAMIARRYFNWGAHGQVTLAPTPWLELQGAGMLNLPGSGLALFRLEGSAYLSFSSLDTGNVVLSSSRVGNMVYSEQVSIPAAERRKFGLEVGAFVDRHAVHYFAPDHRRSDEAPLPLLSLGGYAGLKWVRQMNVGLTGGANNRVRWAYYLHAMYALKQSVDPPAGEPEPKYAPIGARMGFELCGTAGTGPFMRAEGGAMPSFRGPDFNMFLMVGVSHGERWF